MMRPWEDLVFHFNSHGDPLPETPSRLDSPALWPSTKKSKLPSKMQFLKVLGDSPWISLDSWDGSPNKGRR